MCRLYNQSFLKFGKICKGGFMKLNFWFLIVFAVLVAVAIFGIGCGVKLNAPQATTTTTLVQAPPTTAKPQAEALRLAWAAKSEAPLWTKYTTDALAASKLLSYPAPTDLGVFCPGLKKPTIEFYAQLISIMARYESGFKPATSYDESGTKPSLKGVISRGLLQISIASGKSYNPKLKEAEDLHNPQINLETGVLILERWVGRDGQLAGKGSDGGWRGGARYWSVLRTASDSYPKIKSYMNALPVCVKK